MSRCVRKVLLGTRIILLLPGPCKTVSSHVSFKFLLWLKSRRLNPWGLLGFLSDPIALCVGVVLSGARDGARDPRTVCARRLRPLCHLAMGSPVPTGAPGLWLPLPLPISPLPSHFLGVSFLHLFISGLGFFFLMFLCVFCQLCLRHC